MHAWDYLLIQMYTGPRILTYKGIASVTDTDRKRMAAYDSSCEASINESFCDGSQGMFLL